MYILLLLLLLLLSLLLLLYYYYIVIIIIIIIMLNLIHAIIFGLFHLSSLIATGLPPGDTSGKIDIRDHMEDIRYVCKHITLSSSAVNKNNK